MHPHKRRAGVPRPNDRIAPHDVQFGRRGLAWREEYGVTQDGLIALMKEHAGMAPAHKGGISRIEHGLSWATLPLVDAMARVDLAFGGRGRSYWGWGDPVDPTRAKHPAPPLTVDGPKPDEWRELPTEPPAP